MKKASLIIVLLFFVITSTIGQGVTQYTVKKKNASYLLPSPETIARVKSVEKPTGLHTGIPEITIPLWHNKFSSYTIDLNYNSSGIQVNEKASIVGLGWTIEAGGVIARIVRGLPDDMPLKGYLNLSAGTKARYNKDIDDYLNSDSPYMRDIGNGSDEAPDIFYYNFNGIKGKFILNNGKGLSIPRNNLDITYSIGLDNKIEYFKIKTPDGLVYSFKYPEKASAETGVGWVGTISYNSAWYITSIGKLDKEEVTFSYSTNLAHAGMENAIITSESRQLNEHSYFSGTGNEVNTINTTQMSFITPLLTLIQDVNCKTIFLYGTNKELDKIEIHSQKITNEIVANFDRFSEIIFEYGNFSLTDNTTDITRTRRLDNIKIGNFIKKTYSFTYNSAPIPYVNCTEQDLWGYYNNNGSTTLIPQLNYDFIAGIYEPIGFTVANISGANRGANTIAMQAGMLESIENPQGGITQYTFEPNEFIYTGQHIQGGGLRIKQLDYYDNNSELPNKIIKYKYTDFNNPVAQSTGILISKPIDAYYLSNHVLIDNYQRTYRYADFAYGIKGKSSPVIYKQVTIDYDGIGYTVNDFELSFPGHVSGVNLFTDQLNTMRTLNYLDTDESIEYLNSTVLSYDGIRFSDNFVYDWGGVYPKAETNYNTEKEKVTEAKYTYHNLENKQLIHAYESGPKIAITVENTGGDPGNPMGFNTNTSKSYLRKYYYPTAWKLLKSKETINYVNGTALSEGITNLYYNGSSQSENVRFLNKTDVINEDGLIYFEEIKYPFDYTLPTNEQNIINSYTVSLTDHLENNPQGYYQPIGDVFFLNKSIPSNLVLTVPQEMQDMEEDIVAIEELKSRGSIANPIEVINGVEFPDGTKKIISADLFLYKKLSNAGIVASKELLYNEEVNYDDFEKTSYKINPGTGNYTLYYHSDYKTITNYKTYSENGELKEMVGIDNLPIEFKYYDYGTYLKSKKQEGFETQYKYKLLVGISVETDPNDISTYYVYDYDGNLVAVKDNELNIRKAYTQNSVSEEGDMLLDGATEPGGNHRFLKTKPEAFISVDKNSSNSHAKIKINYYNPAVFDYEIDYGDGTSEIVETNFVEHYYPGFTKFNITLKEMKNGYVLNEDRGSIYLEPEPLIGFYIYHRYIFSDWHRATKPTGTIYSGMFKIGASAGMGSGEYTITYQVGYTNSQYVTVSNTYVYNTKSRESVERFFPEEGRYEVTITINDKDEVQTSTESCYFYIRDGMVVQPPSE